MVAGEVESSCQLVVTFFFFFFFFFLVSPYQTIENKSGSAQRRPPSYQLLPPPLQGVITYCDYNSSEKELTLKTAKEYKTVTENDSTICFTGKATYTLKLI